MKTTLLFTLILMGQLLAAQTFREVPTSPFFEHVDRSSVASADVDGDGDLDVLITGRNTARSPISKLYVNDGRGHFSEAQDTPFEGIEAGSVAFADVDGDGDQDVLIAGQNNSGTRITKLYGNDGQGNFTEMLNTPFEGLSYGSIAFADVDGDNDQDVLITGLNNYNDATSKLYLNDGLGHFTEMVEAPFDDVEFSSVVFTDVDGDNDQDAFITGQNSSDIRIAKLYTNDGFGNFTEMLDTPFDGISYGSIAFADIDGDNDKDVLITGMNNADDVISKLYIGDGDGNFTEIIETPFDGLVSGSIAFADVDGDNDKDVLITGSKDALSTDARIAKLYTNDGLGNFIEMLSTPFDAVRFSSIIFSDVDGDSDEDMLLTGSVSSTLPVSNLYVNDGFGDYSEINATPFKGVNLGSIAFADVDGDDDQDVLISGRVSSIDYDYLTKLYTNDGEGKFIEVMDTPFDDIELSSIAFADVDGDNDQDLFIAGLNGLEEYVSKLYINDGTGNFTEKTGNPFDKIYIGSIAFEDVDNDNDQDVFITGRNSSNAIISKLYANDGNGNFAEILNTPFDGVYRSSIAFADVDGDNDKDVLITGSTGAALISKLYTNDGEGNFTEVLDTPFDNVYLGSIAFADVDGDNDNDVLITGQFSFNNYISKLYINDGVGNFTEAMGTPFAGVQQGSIAFADVDGDSDQDVLITGQYDSDEYISKLYTNDGVGNFNEVLDTPFDGVRESSIAFADVDDDNDQDVLITGYKAFRLRISKLYINESVLPSIVDLDQDGFGIDNDCDDNNPNVNPRQAEEPYNGLDDDCDPETLDDDLDQDGFLLVDDCDDTNAEINPNAEEVADNGIDENCDEMDLTTSFHQIKNVSIEIYPNPVSDILNITINEALEYKIELHDLQGRLIYSGYKTQTISVESLSSGTYFLKYLI